MNEPIDNDQPNPATEEAPPAAESTEAYRDLGDAVKKAFRAGAADAKDAARNAVPRAGKEFAKGIHDIAYGVAYLASFGVAIAKELTPEPVSDGFSEGSEAGREAAKKMMEKRREAGEENASTDSGDAPEPEAVPV